MGQKNQNIEINASGQPELANYWGAINMPTIFIIDSKGGAREMNFGAANADKLHEQICEVESITPNYSVIEEEVIQ